jgi:hypothetical protein
MKYIIFPLIAFSLFSCNKKGALESQVVSPPLKSVTYKINCDDCFVWWRNEEGYSESLNHQNSEWEHSFNGRAGDPLEVGVMNSEGSLGYNSVSILLNDEVLQSSSSSCPITGAAFATDTLN